MLRGGGEKNTSELELAECSKHAENLAYNGSTKHHKGGGALRLEVETVIFEEPTDPYKWPSPHCFVCLLVQVRWP